MESRTNQYVHQLYLDLGSDTLVAEQLVKDDAQQVNLDSLRWKIRQLHTKITKLKRDRSKLLESFLLQSFEFPQPKGSVSQTESETSASQTMQENKTLKKMCTESVKEQDKLKDELCKLQSKYDVALKVLDNIQVRHSRVLESEQKEIMRRETKEWQSKFTTQVELVDKMAEQMKTYQEKLSRYNVRNVNKREKRAKERVHELREVNTTQAKEIENLKSEVEEKVDEHSALKCQVGSLRNDKLKLQKHISQIKRRKSNRVKKADILIATNEYEISRLRSKIEEHEREIKRFETINDLMENDTVVTFEDGKYISEMREVIMSLITVCNVSVNRVNSVISTVMQKLAGKLPSHLPSHGIVCRILAKAKFIAQTQICESVVTTSDLLSGKGACLHSDGTTK